MMHLCYLWQEIVAHFIVYFFFGSGVGILSKYSYWVPHILLMFLYSTNQDMFHHICSTSHMIFAVVGPKLSLCGDSHPCLVKLLPNPCYFYILWTRWLSFICMAATPLEIVSMLVSTIIVCHVPCPSLICGGAPADLPIKIKIKYLRPNFAVCLIHYISIILKLTYIFR